MTPTIASMDGGQVRVVVGARGRPDDHHGDGAGVPERRRLEDGRAGGVDGAAHPPPVVPRDAGRRARVPPTRSTALAQERSQGEDVPAHRQGQRARAHRQGHRGGRRAAQPERAGGILAPCPPDDHEGPDRQPRRDRVPRDPRLPRARPAHGRRLLGGRRGSASTCASPTRRSRSGRRRRARATCVAEKIVDAIKKTGADARPPGLRLPVRERRLRRGGRGGGRDVHRAAAGGDPRDGRQDGGARADAGRGRAGRAGRQRRGRQRVRRPPPRPRRPRRASATR